jgi:hypothetical protein
VLSRLGRISLLLFQAIWLNVIIPGHTRGAITLPSSPTASTSCCSHGDTTKNSDPAKPTKDPSRCAICFFAARISLPDTIDLTPPPLALVAILNTPTVESSDFATPPAPFHGRAPPLA